PITRLPNSYSSIWASSMSMTGMSSLMGYTRLQVAHFSAVPFLTSATGVLQLGHARISSNSGSTGMLGLYDTFVFLWNNSTHMKSAFLFVALAVSVSMVEAPQAAAQTTPGGWARTAQAYEQ